MSYAFFFDASACSGCKACQEACKDKNDLPVGVLWRRVIEVTGGTWRTTGASWENTVISYSISMACNHCTYPKCAGVCPADAFLVRSDGIVLLDVSKCMGCRYCTWACPYGALQFIPIQGVVTKCNFCFDNLEAGKPPACVAACPLRVLGIRETDKLPSEEGATALWKMPPEEHPFPLPGNSHTEPHLVVKPHPGMNSPLEKAVANREEIQPARYGKNLRNPAIADFPLVVFTLLVQMSVGMAACLLALRQTSIPALSDVGILLVLAGLSAFFHLGRKRNGWRALTHLRKSWLSREVLLAGLFGAAWATTFALEWANKGSLTLWVSVLLGLGLIFSMAQIYRLRTVPAWNTWRTEAAFYLSAAVLGALGFNALYPSSLCEVIGCLALAGELGLALGKQSSSVGTALNLRIVFLGSVFLSTLLLIVNKGASKAIYGIPIFMIALGAEVIERQQFYAKLLQKNL